MPVRGPLESRRRSVADLRQLHRGALEHAGEQHEGAHVRGGFDQVGGGLERLAADVRQALHGQQLVAGVGVDAGADGGTAQVDLGEQLRRQGLEARQVFAQGGGEGMEFLAEGHGHRVLQLGATHLQHLGEFHALGGEGGDQAVQAGEQGVMAEQQTQADGGGVGVVGRLRHVDVVVRVEMAILALGVAEQLQGDVGDHLVGVHVGRGAGPALDHVHHELVVEFAANDARAGINDRLVLLGRQMAEPVVGVRRRLLDHGQGHHQLGVVTEGYAGEAEVLHGAQVWMP